MKLIDVHAHLNFRAYDNDREAVISHMEREEAGAIIVGTTLKDSSDAIVLSQKHDFLWASVGVHPTEKSEEFDEKRFIELLAHSKAVAVGECGLDFFHTPYDEHAQRELFLKHLILARAAGKPLIIHCRNAHDEMIAVLQKEARGLAGAIHFFTGNEMQAEKYLSLGFYLSFAGPVTFTAEYDSVIRMVPVEKILIETDAPFAAPAPYRGKRNEPAYVIEIAKKIAILKGVSLDEIAKITTQNARSLFKL